MAARGPRALAPRPPGEFALIDAFLAPFGLARDGRGAGGFVERGPGDDCAVLRPARGMRLVVTTDALVEGVHFDRALSPKAGLGWAEDAGHKALAVNLSDLAAAGAAPRAFVCALGVPRGEPAALATARALGRGMARLSRAHGCRLAGGNVARAPAWSLTLTVFGEARRPLSRASGRPGDALVLAGTLGAAALGLRLLQARARGARLPAGASGPLRAQLRPEPLVRAGLVAARFARAAIDVSDGLLQDLGHLARASGCGARVELAHLPRLPAVERARREHARASGHAWEPLVSGGEEYALLLAVPPRRVPALLRALSATGCPGRAVGALERSRRVRLLDAGREVAPPGRAGFDHLAPPG